MPDLEKQESVASTPPPSWHGSRRDLVHTTTNPDYGDREDSSTEDDEEFSKKSSRTSSRDVGRTTSRVETVLSTIRARPALGRFKHPLEHVQTSIDDLVEFDGLDDPYRPVNWPMKKKITTTALYGMTTMAATWASATYSAGTMQVAREFNVGSQVAVLGTTLFLFGFGLGPLLWAPLSEVYGRKNAVIPPMFIGACFAFGTATARDIQTVMITRFFSAFFVSAPVTNTGGVMADLFPPSQRGIAIAGYAMAVVIGPVFGPLVGAAFVVEPPLGWRWTEHFTGILQVTIVVLDYLFIDESYPPRLLIYKARRLRHQSGNWSLHAKFEEWDVSVKELARKFLVRPFQLLTTPICGAVCLYNSFCYGILYMNLGAVPIIFGEKRGWQPLPATLPFLALGVGAMIGAGINILNQFNYNKKGHGQVIPELRLIPMMGGSVTFAVGMFVLGWTADPKFPWIAPVIGVALVGIGFFTIFQAGLNYLVDTFQKYAASAVAANTFLRSCFAGAFPLVISPLYHNVGVPWGTSIFGFFAVAMIPVPFLFYKYGKALRARSKWSRDSVR
jgi:MFS transporter, DHA1 family, multidrug resistance protein